LQEAATTNLHVFVSNRPVGSVDPLGLTGADSLLNPPGLLSPPSAPSYSASDAAKDYWKWLTTPPTIVLGQPQPSSPPALGGTLNQWGQNAKDNALGTWSSLSSGQQIALASLGTAVAGGALYGQYEFTGKTGLGLGDVIPKIGLGNGAKLSLDPSFGLDQGEWSGNLGLGLKDWNPFPNPALTLALGLDGKMNSEGE